MASTPIKKHTIVIESKSPPAYQPTDTFQPASPTDAATRESRAAAAAEIARGQAVISEILQPEARRKNSINAKIVDSNGEARALRESLSEKMV